LSKRFQANEFFILPHDYLLVRCIDEAVPLVDQLEEFVERFTLAVSNLLEVHICAVAENLCEEMLALIFIKQMVLSVVTLSMLVNPMEIESLI